jgi:hypothetical protein
MSTVVGSLFLPASSAASRTRTRKNVSFARGDFDVGQKVASFHHRSRLKTLTTRKVSTEAAFSTRGGGAQEDEEERDAKFARLFAETFESASSLSSMSNTTASSSTDSPKNSLLEILETSEEEGKEEAVSISSILAGVDEGGKAAVRDQHQLLQQQQQQQQLSSSSSSSSSSAVIARWVLVAKYGHKAECIKMLHEWADTVGRSAGLDPAHDILLVSGNIGANESTIELEIRNGLSSVGDFDQLMRNIDVTLHREWGMRFAEHVVDGTTRWEIFTTHPFVSGSSSNSSNSKYSRPGVSRTQPRRVLSPQKKPSTESRTSANGTRPKYEDIPEEELMKYIGKTLPDGRRVVENAFGVPMVINPGDIFFD